jgi:protein O-GlcNAc transferase
MLPLLATHDHAKFEIRCYSDVTDGDSTTEQLRKHADVWRETWSLSDAKLADLIRDDRIDILVDLLMHAKGSRMLTFARKPAPVQVSYLSYASTTGLEAMDYRLSDPYLDPPEADESLYTETTIRLPSTFWCFQPSAQMPEIAPLPASTNGYVTFGCLNNFWKVTPETRTAWMQLLDRVPNSRLVIHCYEGSHRQKLLEPFINEGIGPERIEFVGFLPIRQYFEQYNRIDIALDPFPYCGGTTTCESLWMGAPVVTVLGQTAVGRAGYSILSNIGLGALVARDVEQYLGLAEELAGYLSRLSELRGSLRSSMQSSPLMDAPRFARDIENAYRTMWRRRCA